MHELSFFDIAKFEKGFGHLFGLLEENNINMSLLVSGKNCLLRSLFAMGNYYILDEPTASLDPDAEPKSFIITLEIYFGKSS